MASSSRRSISRLSAAARSGSAKRASVHIRQHTVMIDDAVERGGTDRGPNPPETLLAALGGCLNIQLHRLADKRDIELRRLKISIDADFDRSNVTWGEDIAVPFPLVRVALSTNTDASKSRLAALWRDALKLCPVSRLMLEAGTRFRHTWETVPVTRKN